MSESITLSREEYEALQADKRRLDYLDECNRRLNAHCRTLYGWRLFQSDNVNKLMLDTRREEVALKDSHPVGCCPTGHLSIRKALDAVVGRRESAEEGEDAERLVNEKLIEWGNAWKLDGDLVRCRQCNRGIIYSRRGEKLVHAADCKQWAAYPWEMLISLSPPSTYVNQPVVIARAESCAQPVSGT